MKNHLIVFCTIVLFFKIDVLSQLPNIYINEFLASNSSLITDPDFNKYNDWIELFNKEDSAINLNGYFISDNYNNPSKWQINKDIYIESKQYLIIWCDNKDTIIQSLHTNFKLRMEGEEIALYSVDTILIDSISFSEQKTDISSGRNPVQLMKWEFFNDPTPWIINSNLGYQISKTPVLSLESGFYENNQKLTVLLKDSAVTVRYTLDGTNPTENSDIFPDTLFLIDKSSEANVYSEIRTNQDPHDWLPDWIPPSGNIFKATVLKLRSFEYDKLPSEIVYKTYFIKENMKSRYSLPVISIVTDPDSLFNDTTGIYVPGITHINGNSNTGNYFQDWEREVHMTYFEPAGNIGFSQNVGIRIQGGTSPASPQKAFHVIARDKYGNNRIEYPLFGKTHGRAKDMDEFKRVIIRAWGSTILAAMFNDALAHRIMEGSDLDLQSYQPVILFINGEYWGLHEMREANKSNWYYEAYYGVDTDYPGIDLIYHWDSRTQHYPEANEGDTEHWNDFTAYIHGNDMSETEHYDYIKTQLDIDNFIDYITHTIYLGKWDWPGNNEATWKPRTEDGKWRYIPFDMETGFGVATGLDASLEFLGPQFNMFNHVLVGTNIPLFDYYGPHLVFNELIKNEEFVTSFINNMEKKLLNEFSSSATTAILDEMIDQIEPYMEEHKNRWPFGSEVLNEDWYASINWIRYYLEERPAYVLDQLDELRNNINSIKEIRSNIIGENLMEFIYNTPSDQDIYLQIYSLDGCLIHQLTYKKESLISFYNNWNNNNFNQGIYIHVLSTGSKMKLGKLVKF